ncbi:MAG: hypothetical protein R3F59_21415 [Myxococcota bacterium]
MIERRTPGQRRRRSRREDELAQVEALDPEQAEALRALRGSNPQAYRKALRKLIRAGTIHRGRGFDMAQDVLALLEPDKARAAIDGLAKALEAGSLGFRELAGLREAERMGAARGDVLGWLDAQYDGLLDRDNRTVPQVTQR